MLTICAILLVTMVCVSGVDLGNGCTDDLHCNVIVDAVCKNGRCECTANTLQHENRCVQVFSPQSSCFVDDDCKTAEDQRRLCVSNKCVCIPNHHQIGNNCETSRSLREPCLSDEQCYWGQSMRDKMSCKYFKCSCNKGFHPFNGRVCRSGANVYNVNISLILAISFLLLF